MFWSYEVVFGLEDSPKYSRNFNPNSNSFDIYEIRCRFSTAIKVRIPK